MVDSDVLDKYYDYLLGIINFNLPKYRRYGRLVEELFDTEFYYVHPMDENRMNDGLYLRKEFLFDIGMDVHEDLWIDPCSVLEVLVAFSKRIEIEITGEPGEDDLGRWFWVMVKNLGILYPNNEFDHGIVQFKLENWMSRKFEKSGNGSIFPLKNWRADQRDVEMWYQMQAYLNENWEF